MQSAVDELAGQLPFEQRVAQVTASNMMQHLVTSFFSAAAEIVTAHQETIQDVQSMQSNNEVKNNDPISTVCLCFVVLCCVFDCCDSFDSFVCKQVIWVVLSCLYTYVFSILCWFVVHKNEIGFDVFFGL